MEHATVYDLFITEIQAFVLTEFGQTEFVSFYTSQLGLIISCLSFETPTQ